MRNDYGAFCYVCDAVHSLCCGANLHHSALENAPIFPTYPSRMPKADVTAGLVLPNAAVAMLGSGTY